MDKFIRSNAAKTKENSNSKLQPLSTNTFPHCFSTLEIKMDCYIGVTIISQIICTYLKC